MARGTLLASTLWLTAVMTYSGTTPQPGANGTVANEVRAFPCRWLIVHHTSFSSASVSDLQTRMPLYFIVRLSMFLQVNLYLDGVLNKQGYWTLSITRNVIMAVGQVRVMDSVG